MSNAPGSLALVSSQADEREVSLSNVKLNKACDATSAVKFNTGELKSVASQNFKESAD